MGQKQQVKFNKNSIDPRKFYEQQLGRQLKGNNWVNGGLCVFHPDTQEGSLRVNLSHGGFIDYACGKKGGDVIDFLRLRYGWDFNQAVSYLLGSEECQPEKKPKKTPELLPDREKIRQGIIQQWEQANPADSNHAYLISKRIKPLGSRQLGRNLLIPAYSTQGLIRGILNIGEKGNKWFSKGSDIQGNYFLVGKETRTTLIICEGYSTGATLHEQSGYQVAVAFNAGNLEPVALALRETQPDREIIIAADNDRYHKDGTPRKNNPGLEAATKSANRINAKLAVPEFPDGVLGSDFNDLANLGVLS